MAGVIIPKTYVDNVESPLIFLAGPIKGAPLWQDEAIRILFAIDSQLTVASPRRGIRENIAAYILNGDDNNFPRQRAWEKHYLERASKTGAILFWLPGEVEHSCEKSYAAMTRKELGDWTTAYRYDKSIRFCVGSDGKFSELDTLKYDLSIDIPDKVIMNSLEETCEEALRLAKQ